MSDSFDKVINNLDNIAANAEKLNGNHKYDTNEIFTPSFMRRNTSYSSFDSFLKDCNIHTQAEFDACSNSDFDKKVREKTKFSNYQDMLNAAMPDFVNRKLGL